MKKINEQYSIETGTNSNGQTVISLYKTHGKWENGDVFELSHRQYIKSFYSDQYDAKDRDINAEILHEIFLNDWTRWNKELTKDQKVEISEAIYEDLLGCVPPKIHLKNYFEVGEPHSHDNKGRAIHRACWIENGKYYTGYPKQKETANN